MSVFRDQAAIRPATVAELAKRLLLGRADEGDVANPYGRAVFWIGAGTSVSAGIPSGYALAGRLAQRIAVKLGLVAGSPDDDTSVQHEAAFAMLKAAGEIGANHTLSTAYGELFGRLDATQQRDFIRRVIVRTNRRQINWSHLAIGELVRQRIVHTLLTTNFDDLLLDGLVRCDQLPAIIDGVESLNRMDPRPPVPQLVYLHGSQHTYSPRNSTEAVLGTRDLAQAQGGLFGLLQQCSTLVVVGYAGNAGEGVMELLLRVCRTLPELPIFWIAHGQHDSLSGATVELLRGSLRARLIAGQDADLFFRELLRETRIGVPVWFREPVDHLLQLAERIRVDSCAESVQLREEVEDFRQRLRELHPHWASVGSANLERRQLRQLALSDSSSEVWERLKNRALDDVRLLQMRADAAYELGRLGHGDLLPQSVRDNWAALKKLTAGSAEWAFTQQRLGDALATMGERGDERATRDAIDAYQRALQVLTRELAPIKWASTRNNQGLAFLTLGEWGDHSALEHALNAFRDALTVYRRDAMPTEWAATHSNLADALQILGKAGDPARLEEAIAAYSDALKIQTRELMPTDWAMTTCNRATALLALGQQGQATHWLREAAASLDEAIEVVPRQSLPLYWATIKNNQGAALLALGQLGDQKALMGAIVAFREALEVRAHKAMAVDWVATSSNLGSALLAMGMRGDEAALREAMEILSTAMDLLSDDAFPAGGGLDIESLAQQVFSQLWGVAKREPAPVPGVDRRAPADGHPAANGRAASRILVVEDNEVHRELIKDLLYGCIGHAEVKVHAAGAAALDDLRSSRWDLLVLDLQLPDMPGQEVLAQAKALNPRLPVLVYSDDAQAIQQLRQQQAAQPGAGVALLQKDGRHEEFTRLVPTLFKRRQRDAAPAVQ